MSDKAVFSVNWGVLTSQEAYRRSDSPPDIYPDSMDRSGGAVVELAEAEFCGLAVPGSNPGLQPMASRGRPSPRITRLY